MSIQWRESCPVLFLSSWTFSVNWSTKFIFSILLLCNFESDQCFYFSSEWYCYRSIRVPHKSFISDFFFAWPSNFKWYAWPSAQSLQLLATKQYLKFEMDFRQRFSDIYILSLCVCSLQCINTWIVCDSISDASSEICKNEVRPNEKKYDWKLLSEKCNEKE